MSAHVTFSSNQYFSDQNDEKSDTLPPEAAIFTQLRKGERVTMYVTPLDSESVLGLCNTTPLIGKESTFLIKNESN